MSTKKELLESLVRQYKDIPNRDLVINATIVDILVEQDKEIQELKKVGGM